MKKRGRTQLLIYLLEIQRGADRSSSKSVLHRARRKNSLLSYIGVHRSVGGGWDRVWGSGYGVKQIVRYMGTAHELVLPQGRIFLLFKAA